MAGIPFERNRYSLGTDRTGQSLHLVPVPDAAAAEFGKAFSEIDPWITYEIPAESLSAFLSNEREDRHRFLISANGENAGIVVVTVPWLHGPYLHFLGMLPAFQNRGIGTAVMDWFEGEATGHFRNLWVCVSGFNKDAVRFYERLGYLRVATLEDLVKDGRDEILLRKHI